MPADVRELLGRLRQLKRTPLAGDWGLLPQFRALTDAADLEVVGQAMAGLPAEALAQDGNGFRPARVALISSANADGLVPLLRVLLVQQGVWPEFYLSGFNQYVRELIDPTSGLATFRPDLTLCLLHEEAFLPEDWSPTELEALRSHVMGRVDELAGLLRGFADRSGGTVAITTVPLPRTVPYGVTALKSRARLGATWREMNGALLGLSDQIANLFVIDLECLLADHPGELRDRRLYRYASIAWRDEVLLLIGRELVNLYRAVAGLAKKCLVLDLDNTLWGGVLGDDGLEGIQVGHAYPGNCYREFQRRVLALERQGVILGICSKNERTLVDEAFAGHPELLLRSENFAMIAANWAPKDRNLVTMAERLNIGLDSVVFADDSLFECDLVAGNLPEVTVVRLDGDPADHIDRLLGAGLFDVPSTTAEDQHRTQSYRTQVQRGELAQRFASIEDYLRQLQIKVELFPADGYTLPRLVQLNLRTNQFRMTEQRLTEAEVRAQMESGQYLILGFAVADRFGDEGIVGGIWIRKDPAKWVVENFVMSCRVFSRHIEHAVLQHVLQLAAAAGVACVEAEFRPTAKNKVAAAFYPVVGFECVRADIDGSKVYRLAAAPAPAISPDWVSVVAKEASGIHA